jgi:hypothetical protein
MTKKETRTMESRVSQIEDTLKKAMLWCMPGEQLHIVAVVYEQNELICQLKAQVRQLKKAIYRINNAPR